MKSAVERLEPTRVKLTVEVPFDELKSSVDAAYRKVGQQVRVPGFRPGKVPPRIIDQRIGRGVVLEEAVNEAVPRLYGEALEEGKLRALGQPEIDVTGFEDGGELAFTAEVDVRPEIGLPEYEGIEVSVDDVADLDEKVDAELDAMRDRFATLSVAERPAVSGDFVMIDLAAEIDGAEVDALSASGLSYEVGTQGLVDGLDAAIEGLAAGESRAFTTTIESGDHAGEQAEVTVTVKTVRAKDVPALDDDFAQESSEFDTLEELKTSVRQRVERMARIEQGLAAREAVLTALLSRVEVPLPERIVTGQIDDRLAGLDQQLEAYGMTREQYLGDRDPDDFERELRESVERDLRSQFVLDELAAKEELGIEEAELTEFIVHRAGQAGVSPDEYAQRIVQAGAVPSVVAEVLRAKALGIVLSKAVVTDSSGNKVDLEALSRPPGAPSPQADAESGAPEPAPASSGAASVPSPTSVPVAVPTDE